MQSLRAESESEAMPAPIGYSDHPLRNEMLRLQASFGTAARLIGLCVALCIGMAAAVPEPGIADMRRFFHSGDGIIHLKSEKNGHLFEGRYREQDQRYNTAAYRKICDVFDAPYDPQQRFLSLRLIEFLDMLADQLGSGALLTITSGYRDPEYNKRLRNGGVLAAKASLHQYGMAADFIMDGVSSERIWQHVRKLGFGGTGYYHGRTVHVDVGPARFWDEQSSGVGTGLSDDNKLIGLVTDYDRYSPGDWMDLRFIRMTAFPIKVRPAFLMIPQKTDRLAQSPMTLTPEIKPGATNTCRQFNSIRQMASLRWRLPTDVRSGRYRIQAAFCGDEWKQMPAEVATPYFEVGLP